MERKHETKVLYLIDNEDSAEEHVVDLAELSDEELGGYVLVLPQALDEVLYRALIAEPTKED